MKTEYFMKEIQAQIENNPDAADCYQIAMNYRYGYDDVEVDLKKAEEWFRKAAEQGNISAPLALWSIYYLGEGVEIDLKEAFKWCKIAAEQGHSIAQYYLACMLCKGEGCEQDYMEAYIWYLMMHKRHKLSEDAIKHNNKVIEHLSDEQKEFVKKQAEIRFKKIKERLTS